MCMVRKDLALLRKVHMQTKINGVLPRDIILSAVNGKEMDWVPVVEDLKTYMSVKRLSSYLGRTDNYIENMLKGKKQDMPYNIGLRLERIHKALFSPVRHEELFGGLR